MKKKLSEWARENSISYISAYRWFKEDKLPIVATQLPSGMIMVDESSTYMKTEKNEAISELLKKTTELSKNNGTVEDLAAYVVSNFNIQIAKDDEKKDIKSLLKNSGGQGALVPKNTSISLNSSLSDYSWNSQIQVQPTENLMTWNGNPNFGAAPLSVSAQTEPNEFSFYGSQNAACGGGLISDSSIFYTGPTTANLCDIVGVEDHKEITAQNPEQPPKRGRGRPKKIHGEEK